jgi:hypothetical protein
MRALLVLVFAGCVQAGTIQGIVLEHASGRPLARSVVRLDPVPQASGNKAQPLTQRVGLSGQFVFPSVTPGFYIVTAIHDGYFPVAFGQRLPLGHGAPIEITKDSTLFAELRLRHKGAVTGRVLDENGVGAAGIPVFAYRARAPLRSAGSAVSDDRGVFRIPGLEAGKYWVRSGAATLVDSTTWLPTFAREARETRDARVYQITYDSDTGDADVSPEPGRLFQVTGIITCEAAGPLLVVLSSEIGRRTMQTECSPTILQANYHFEGLGPALYEVFAKLQDNSAAGFTELYLDHDMRVDFQVARAGGVEFDIRRLGSNAALDIPITLLGRRQDLAETETEVEITRPRSNLGPGHWEIRARVPAGYYVDSITSQRSSYGRLSKVQRASDWFDLYIEGRSTTRVRITVSDQGGQITGTVTSDGKPSMGAPVFLWPVADNARRSLNGPAQTLSDTDGHFRFDSLPPGDYRMLASFDVNEIDEDVLELSHAQVIHVDAAQTVPIDLKVWLAP